MFSPALPFGRGGQHLSLPENAGGAICPKLLPTPFRRTLAGYGGSTWSRPQHTEERFGAFPHPGHTQGTACFTGLAAPAAPI